MADEMNTYAVTYKRDDNDTWFVNAVDVQGAHSYGRTIERARANIREAIAVVLDVEPDDFEIVEGMRLDDLALDEAFADARKARVNSEIAAAKAQLTTADALELFEKSDETYSVRDLAALLGISHQRVQQILTDVRRGVEVG